MIARLLFTCGAWLCAIACLIDGGLSSMTEWGLFLTTFKGGPRSAGGG